MTEGREPSSFRDPSGFLFRRGGVLYRQVNPVFRDHYRRMIESGFYREAVEAGLLVPHDEVGPDEAEPDRDGAVVIRPERIPFVSYPYEWSYTQLRDAAGLTLELQKRALRSGLWLKDASAYNVQFRGSRPVFIDTLSFETWPEGRPWVAYQQFCRHFLAPLLLMRHVHPDLGKLSRVYVDGVPLELASRLLPARTRLSPGALLHVHWHARALRKHAAVEEGAVAAAGRRLSRQALLGIVDSLEASVRRLDWEPTGTEWADYYEETNYSDEALEAKKRIVGAFLDEARPGLVWDLGANVGPFSRLATARGIDTVSMDADPVAVDRNYRAGRREKDERLLPLVVDFTNPSPALGWDHDERASLRSRGPADLVMALALVHHLAIGNNVPLERVVSWLAGLGRRAIVEFVPKTDSQVRRLLASREDVFPDYSTEGFERALTGSFRIRRREPVPGSGRSLYLLEPDEGRPSSR